MLPKGAAVVLLSCNNRTLLDIPTVSLLTHLGIMHNFFLVIITAVTLSSCCTAIKIFDKKLHTLDESYNTERQELYDSMSKRILGDNYKCSLKQYDEHGSCKSCDKLCTSDPVFCKELCPVVYYEFKMDLHTKRRVIRSIKFYAVLGLLFAGFNLVINPDWWMLVQLNVVMTASMVVWVTLCCVYQSTFFILYLMKIGML